MESQGLSKKTFQRNHRLFEIFPPTLAASLCQLLWLPLWPSFPSSLFSSTLPVFWLVQNSMAKPVPMFPGTFNGLAVLWHPETSERVGSLECQGVLRRGQSWGHSQLPPPGGDIFTKLLYPLLARLWPFWAPGSLSPRATRPPPAPPGFLHSPIGVPIITLQNPILCSPYCIVWKVASFSFSGFVPHQYIGQCFVTPTSLKCFGRGFVEPRPPAGIREDNSGAFRWVFLWLLLLSSSGNIIGTVHFAAASLLCPAVTQSIRLSCSSFSLGVEACLSFVIALQFTPCNSKEIDFSVFFFYPRAFCT